MISGMVKMHLQKKKKNKGAALVMVIVSIAFIGMLVAMILYMSYANYIMKGTDKRTKDNFYSAEYALDVINAGIQTDISNIMSQVYVDTMQNSEGMTAGEMATKFESSFSAKMLAMVRSASDSGKWEENYIKNKWNSNGVFDVSTSAGALPTGSFVGSACLETTADHKLDASNADYFDIKGVKITYTDKNGYVSVITTDIRVTIPSIDFAQASSMLSVERYSLIANDEFLNISNTSDYLANSGTEFNPNYNTVGNFGSGNLEISGNVFGGYIGIKTDNQKRTVFRTDQNDIDNNIANGDPIPTYLLAANEISVDNCKDTGTGLTVSGNTIETYVSNINVNTANLTLGGSTFVADDLEISGSRSTISLSGIYKGYGMSNTSASGSSSILINGVSTTLDFSQLQTLSLAGHAYVGATRYDADVNRQATASTTDTKVVKPEDLDSDKYNTDYSTNKANQYDEANSATGVNVYPQNKSDIMMGQSIAVKAEQLLYMVPSEYVGFDKDTNTYAFSKNPLTYDEYVYLSEAKSEKFKETNADGTVKKDAAGNDVMQNRFDVVNLEKLKGSITGTNVKNLSYKPVFRRVSGSVLVYLYLDFGTNEVTANDFYKSCINTNPDQMKNYITSYVRDIRFSPALIANSDVSLNLAGNAFYMNDGNIVFQSDTTDVASKANQLYDEADKLAEKYIAAMHSLQTDYDLMLAEQEGTEIFDYLVPDVSVLGVLKGKDLTDGTVHAVVSDEDVFFKAGKVADAANTHVIITSKDVYLDADFTGLVIAGGRIIVGSNCHAITYNPAKVVQTMKTYVDVGGRRRYTYEALGENGIATYGVATGSSNGDITIRELITYQNWKKE